MTQCSPEESAYGKCLTDAFEVGILCCKVRSPNRKQDKRANKRGAISGKKMAKKLRRVLFPLDQYVDIILRRPKG